MTVFSYDRHRRRLWFRKRVQLGGGIGCAVLLPFALLFASDPSLLGKSLFANSVAGSLLAVVVGYYLFRSLITFPGIQASYYILPAFSSAYAAMIAILFFGRLDYTRPLLIVSYFVCIGWYYGIHLVLQRQLPLRVAVVPFGAAQDVRDLSHMRCEILAAPPPIGHGYSLIVADFRADMPPEWERFLADAALAGVTVVHVKRLRESLTGRVELEHLSENSTGSLIPLAAYLAAKRVVDMAAAALLIVFLLPLLALIGLWIRLDSPGPAIFRQLRVGHRGSPFMVFKFRTMLHRPSVGLSSDASARQWAITCDEDSRVTRAGRLLRRSRLDELPQIVNVLLGQMSLIGPRPEAEVLSRWYEREIPFYRYRHIVRPGITGWAQVNQGHVAELSDVHAKLHYDFFYISNFSLWLDILIVFRTCRTMLTGFGSR